MISSFMLTSYVSMLRDRGAPLLGRRVLQALYRKLLVTFKYDLSQMLERVMAPVTLKTQQEICGLAYVLSS